MKQSEPVIHSDPEIMGGTPVFVGTLPKRLKRELVGHDVKTRQKSVGL